MKPTPIKSRCTQWLNLEFSSEEPLSYSLSKEINLAVQRVLEKIVDNDNLHKVSFNPAGFTRFKREPIR